MKRNLCFVFACALLAAALGGCGAPTEPASPGGSVSATVDSETAFPAARWKQQALILTEQIVDSCLQSFDESAGITALNDREIFNFLCTIPQYYEEPGYPYAETLTITEPDAADPNLVAHIPERDAQTIAYQLFGQSDWFYDAPDCYDGAVPEYRFNLEAGAPYSSYSCQDAAAVLSGDSVTVSFRLTDSLLFEGATEEPLAEYGSFEAVYRLVSEEDRSFLRLENIRPV